MSRGFDVDDFRDSDSSRNVSRGSSSGWNSSDRLAEIHREEERTDQRKQEQRDRPIKTAPPFHAKNEFKPFSLSVFVRSM